MTTKSTNSNKETDIITYTVKHKYPITFLVFLYLCLAILVFYVSQNTIVVHTTDKQQIVVDVIDLEKDKKLIRYDPRKN